SSLMSLCRFYLLLAFNVPSAARFYTLSLHDALPISGDIVNELHVNVFVRETHAHAGAFFRAADFLPHAPVTELFQFLLLVCSHLDRKEHTSELQSRENLVCRLLLEKKTVSHPS